MCKSSLVVFHPFVEQLASRLLYNYSCAISRLHKFSACTEHIPWHHVMVSHEQYHAYSSRPLFFVRGHLGAKEASVHKMSIDCALQPLNLIWPVTKMWLGPMKLRGYFRDLMLFTVNDSRIISSGSQIFFSCFSTNIIGQLLEWEYYFCAYIDFYKAWHGLTLHAVSLISHLKLYRYFSCPNHGKCFVTP